MPFFSVVIPLYNKQFFIGNTLKSLLNQDFCDFEVIIINDGSTDESEKIVLEFEDQRIRYFTQINQGVSLARNYGIEKANANYIAFLDADDFWHPDFLAVMHQYIIQFPEHKVFASAIEIETSKTVFKPEYAIKESGDYAIVDYFESSVKESVIWTSSAVFNRNVFARSGVFNEQLKVLEDIDLWIRIGLHFKIVFIWKVLSRYVYDGASLSRNQMNYTYTNTFSAYSTAAKNNPALKKFLDLNRFSLAIKSKLMGDRSGFKKYLNEIQHENLDHKKRLLLQLPSFVLRILIQIRIFLANAGLISNVFR